MQLTPEEQKKQEYYRDARFTKQYDGIWKSVGKCVFCDLREKYVFFEENGVVMTISLYAYIDGHFMIMPRRHIRSPKELSQIEWDTIRKFFYIAKKLIRDVHGIKGMQLVQKDGSDAQSTVDQHLHFHCIPFDAPDLCEWNYRKLQYTPLENVGLYKKAAKKIASLDTKYDEKYANISSVPLSCNAVILNSNGEVLLQERAREMKLTPDTLTLPGGHVTNFNVALETELAREVQEETGLDISKQKLLLLDSSLQTITFNRYEQHINASYDMPHTLLWNTYLVTERLPEGTAVTPGDDCQAIVWMDLQQATEYERVSPGTQAVLKKAWERLHP
ncbi:MAG TPA: NUDIX domain-containing protein [Candidatus Saccharimonadales bacterium]|nr:NUDIX domain-containing protein [Candidatus Saccharimonadales bacterium]